ncbi:hypothetical protein BDR26DRAFT_66713 [Obelidium mucronatum]|nr:hypothetical protein BDR26DRAFT_66713 [Obelidium mucronatum]
MEFLTIPAPFHAAAFTSLITSVQAQKKFHEAVHAAMEETDTLRKNKYMNTHRQRELRLLIRNLEGEVGGVGKAVEELEKVVEEVKGVLGADSSSGRVLSPDERIHYEKRLKESTHGLENYKRDMEAKTTILQQYAIEFHGFEKTGEELKLKLIRNANKGADGWYRGNSGMIGMGPCICGLIWGILMSSRLWLDGAVEARVTEKGDFK